MHFIEVAEVNDKSEAEPSLIILKSTHLAGNNNPKSNFPEMAEQADISQENMPKQLEISESGIPIDVKVGQKVEKPGGRYKRFDEFIGKRAVFQIPGEFVLQKTSKTNGDLSGWGNDNAKPNIGARDGGKIQLDFNFKQISPKNLQKLLNNPEFTNIVANIHRSAMARLNPKRGYELVGKRFSHFKALLGNGDVPTPSELQAEHSKRYDLLGKRLADFLQKKYDYIGKKNADDFVAKRYDLLGKRHDGDSMSSKRYDLLGKRYDLLGKRNFGDNLGSKRYDLLGKRNFGDNLSSKRYDLLGKRSEGDDLSSKRYDLLGKRNDRDEIASKRYDLLGKRTINGDGLSTKRYDLLGKRNAVDEMSSKRYDLLGKRSDLSDSSSKRYDLVGKREYELIGKRGDFLHNNNGLDLSENESKDRRSYALLGKKNYAILGKRVLDEDNGDEHGEESDDFAPSSKTQSNDFNAEGDEEDLSKSDGSLDDGEIQTDKPEWDKPVLHKRYSEWLGKRSTGGRRFDSQLVALLRNNNIRKRLMSRIRSLQSRTRASTPVLSHNIIG